MSATDTAAKPDLSHLPYETRVRIAVAETQGYEWRRSDRTHCASRGWVSGPAWWLIRACAIHPVASVDVVTGRFASFPYLIQYLDDPAAWGALMKKERIGVRPDSRGWNASHDDEPQCAVWNEALGWAVSLCALAKYGVEVKS